ncbi:MAG: hypothetical protein UY63_C0011G0017 [Parcubacteria group bacterium GW2011_GWA2_51_10]|nr:MAG: hypothetical protein UY63_C0011G0017 [Parcubacteria group bacterium GW2011_GWA2_51_10]
MHMVFYLRTLGYAVGATFLLSVLLLGMTPQTAYAFEFGGRASLVIPCFFSGAVYAVVGPPRGGSFIWTPFTRTYPFGLPTHSGQWLLGLTGIPYICIVTPIPFIIIPGISISMMGSSQ